MKFKKMQVFNGVVCGFCEGEDFNGMYYLFIGRIQDVLLNNTENNDTYKYTRTSALEIPLLAYKENLFHLIPLESEKEYNKIIEILEAIL